MIDIADRNPIEYPHGVIYKLKSELIVPQIDTSDISAVFEEHRVVRNLSTFQHIADVSILWIRFHFISSIPNIVSVRHWWCLW